MKTSTMNQRLRAFRLAGGSLLAGAILAGCAAPASQQGMTATAPAATAAASAPAPLKVVPKPYSVAVTTSGGQATGAADSSNIGNAELKAAIEASIRDSKAFTQVIQGPGGDYELAVNVITLDKPSFGFSFTVNLEAGWTLTRASDKQVVFRRAIKSTHTVGAGEAFVGATRLRLAVEGAVRNNIVQGLTAISDAAI